MVTNAVAGIPLLNNQQTVNLLDPGRVVWRLRATGGHARRQDPAIGCTRTLVGVDIYNLFNANPGLTYQQAFVGTARPWYNPTTLLMPRFVRFNITTDF